MLANFLMARFSISTLVNTCGIQWQIFAEKQLKELKNGRLAMIAVLGELMAQQVSGYGTYEQLGLIVKSLPLPL